MTNLIKRRIQEINEKGYSIDLGTIIEKSFENYKKVVLKATVAILLLFALIMAIALTASGYLYSSGKFSEDMAGFDITSFGTPYIIGYIAVIALISGIMAPFTAGLLKMCYAAAHDEEVEVSFMFSYYSGPYFSRLFFSGILISLLNACITTALEFTIVPFAGTVLSLIVSLGTLLVIPLIIFGDLTIGDAIKNSVTIVLKGFFMILLIYIIAAIGAMIGFFAFCIGILFTMPFLYCVIYTLYEQIVGTDATSEIDEIGSSDF